jgi:hypothetical protein
MSEKKFKAGTDCSVCGSTTYREIFKPFSMNDCVVAEQPMVIAYACCGCKKEFPNPETYPREKTSKSEKLSQAEYEAEYEVMCQSVDLKEVEKQITAGEKRRFHVDESSRKPRRKK